MILCSFELNVTKFLVNSINLTTVIFDINSWNYILWKQFMRIRRNEMGGLLVESNAYTFIVLIVLRMKL